MPAAWHCFLVLFVIQDQTIATTTNTQQACVNDRAVAFNSPSLYTVLILEVLQNEISVPLFEKIGDVCWIYIVISKFRKNREMFVFNNWHNEDFENFSLFGERPSLGFLHGLLALYSDSSVFLSQSSSTWGEGAFIALNNESNCLKPKGRTL